MLVDERARPATPIDSGDARRLFIFEPYPMGQTGGNLRTLAYIFRYLDRRRLCPILVAPMETEFVQRAREKEIDCLILEPPASIGRYAGQVLRDRAFKRFRAAVDLLRYNLQVSALVRRHQADVVYCNSIRSLLCAGLGAKLAGRKVLWYVKGQLDNGLLDRLGFLLADRILFFCASNRDDRYPRIVRFFDRKIGILHIGIDPAIVKAAQASDKTQLRRDLGVDSSCTNIAILGQVYRPKGIHVVLSRLGELVTRHPSVMLWIVGDHVLEEFRPYRAELESLIAAQGLESHVRFTGWRKDALQILALMDIVAHPSLAEGFGRAVLEAMAMGKPVVASRVGGLREAIDDGQNGFLVEPGDRETFLARLTQLVEAPSLREEFGRQARATVEAHYLIEDKVAQFQAEILALAR